MSGTQTVKQQRVTIRLDSRSKQKLVRAAACTKESLSEFIREGALSAADEAIREHRTLSLSREDWQVFLHALETPPEPNAKLKLALAEYRKQRLR